MHAPVEVKHSECMYSNPNLPTSYLPGSRELSLGKKTRFRDHNQCCTEGMSCVANARHIKIVHQLIVSISG